MNTLSFFFNKLKFLNKFIITVCVFLLQLSQVLKRDVVNTVFSRVEMLLEDLLMSEGGEKIIHDINHSAKEC